MIDIEKISTMNVAQERRHDIVVFHLTICWTPFGFHPACSVPHVSICQALLFITRPLPNILSSHFMWCELLLEWECSLNDGYWSKLLADKVKHPFSYQQACYKQMLCLSCCWAHYTISILIVFGDICCYCRLPGYWWFEICWQKLYWQCFIFSMLW